MDTRALPIPAIALGAALVHGAVPYPEGSPVPRSLTPEEAAQVAEHPIVAPRTRFTAPPTGPVRAPAEYEPMESIIIAWEGTTEWRDLLRIMGVGITTVGDADLWVYTDTQPEADSAYAQLVTSGADGARVHTIVLRTDTIWIRDYGPQYIYEGGVRAAVDHTYNRPRPYDNAVPADYAARRGHLYYDAPLVHGGGNFQLAADATGYATELIADENPSLTEPEIVDIWRGYWGIDTTITDALPASVDSTQHIDMWMQMAAPDKVVISDWPAQAGTAQDNVCDFWAAELAARGFGVTRVPARTVSGTHYTYTNVLICNDLVLVPAYTNPTILAAGYNDQALAAWRAVFPDKIVGELDCQSIVTSAGVMHCITKHVPANSGGANPVAYLRAPNGNETFNPGDTVDIAWISDDDVATTTVDLELSTDAGATFATLAAAEPDDGHYLWTVPDRYSNGALIRVVAHDADGHTGSDVSDAPFTINGSPACPADLDANGTLNLDDINLFVAAFLAADPAADPAADLDHNGSLNLDDVNAFAASFVAGCP